MDNSVTLYFMNCTVSKQSVLEIKDVLKSLTTTSINNYRSTLESTSTVLYLKLIH